MKPVFLGSGTFGLASLRALVGAGFPPALVVTQPPRRRRRRGGPEPTPVQAEAEAGGVPVVTPSNVNAPDALEELRAAGAPLFVVAEYGQILSQDLLDIPPLGAVNVHASLLPRHRGASPVSAAILAGDTETGITIQRVVRRLDAGPILAERRCAVEPDDDAGTLAARLAPMGGELLVEVVRAIEQGRAPAEREQDESLATYCKRLTPEDAVLDWSHSAADVARRVRAMAPRPGAHTRLLREPAMALIVRRAAPVEGSGAPGVVARVSRDGFEVGTGEGLLRVVEVVPASRRPMPARDFVNGYRLNVGERLG